MQVPDGNGGYKEVFKKDIRFSVDRYMLAPEILVDDTTGNKLNPKVGESINLSTVNIQLMAYDYEYKRFFQIGDPDTLKIVLGDYDTKDWTIHEVTNSESLLPVMTRKTKGATWFELHAMELDMEANQWHVIATRTYYFDEVTENHPHTHTWKTGKITKEATCTETGIRVDACDCGKTIETIIPAKGHTEVKDAAVAATVFAEGKTEGSHCSTCGIILTAQTTVAKLTPTISLTASSLKMKVGQSTTKFKASGFVSGDYVTKVTSRNSKIVKVTNVKKNGTFKLKAGKKKGNTTVTVFLASGKRASFKVTVQKDAVTTTKIAATTKKLTLKKGKTYKKLASSIVVTPVTSEDKITYSSSKKSVATVSSKGVIKAKKAGTTKITVTSGDEEVIVTVKVNGVKTTKLSGVPNSKKLAKGKSFTIKATATPKNTDEKITYTSSNKKVATITSKGLVKGLRKGTAIITVRSGSKKITCQVTVE